MERLAREPQEIRAVGGPARADAEIAPHWMASQGNEKAPGLLDVSVFLQHGAVLDQMEPLPWFPLVPLSSWHDRVEGQRFIHPRPR